MLHFKVSLAQRSAGKMPALRPPEIFLNIFFGNCLYAKKRAKRPGFGVFLPFKRTQQADKSDRCKMIKVENLTKIFGAKHAVDGVSFTVERGEVLGFLGPNGAGKSTTMRMLTGFLPPTSGKVTVG